MDVDNQGVKKEGGEDRRGGGGDRLLAADHRSATLEHRLDPPPGFCRWRGEIRSTNNEPD